MRLLKAYKFWFYADGRYQWIEAVGYRSKGARAEAFESIIEFSNDARFAEDLQPERLELVDCRVYCEIRGEHRLVDVEQYDTQL